MATEFNRLVEEGKIDPRLYTDDTDASHEVRIHVEKEVNPADYAHELLEEGTIYKILGLDRSADESVIEALMYKKYISFLAQRDNVKKIAHISSEND